MRSGFVLVLALVGCGSDDSAGPADTRPADVATEVPADVTVDVVSEAAEDAVTPPTSKVPPPRPTATGSGTTKWYAFTRVDLGGFTRATHAPSTDAWRGYGYDLDGRATTAADSAESKGSCKRAAGSSSAVLADGLDGIDNNFGARILPLVSSVSPDAEKIANDNLAAGQWTLLLRLDNVGPVDNASVPGALYVGHSWDGTRWQIADVSTLDGATVDKPKVRLDQGYMAGGLWVSNELGKETLPVTLVMFGVATTFPLESGVISVRVSDGLQGTVAGGTVTTELLAAFAPLLETFGICKGSSTFEFFAKAVAASPDLVSRAPKLQDPTKSCDAVSQGLGFEMKPTIAPTVVAKVPASPPSLCP